MTHVYWFCPHQMSFPVHIDELILGIPPAPPPGEQWSTVFRIETTPTGVVTHLAGDFTGTEERAVLGGRPSGDEDSAIPFPDALWRAAAGWAYGASPPSCIHDMAVDGDGAFVVWLTASHFLRVGPGGPGLQSLTSNIGGCTSHEELIALAPTLATPEGLLHHLRSVCGV